MFKDKEWVGLQGFVWFFGVIEDVNDPLKIGRVRVRCQGWHSNDVNSLPTSSLPWAQPLQPINSAAQDGIGISPTGLLIGSWVIGFFTDGERAQFPIILGSLAGIPTSTDIPDVSDLARNDSPQLVQDKKDSVKTNVPIAKNRVQVWSEPESPYNAEYPHNHVRKTESGHVVEFDDTPESERIHEYHKAGTFYEIHPDGSKVARIVKDNYEVVVGDNNIYVKQNTNLTSENSINIESVSDTMTIRVGNTVKIIAEKSVVIDAPGGLVVNGSITATGAISSKIGASGKFSSPSGKSITMTNGIVTSIS